MKEGWKTEKLNDVCIIDYGTRVVRKKDGGSIYPVYGGGGATFKMDTFNRENCLVVARFAMSEQCTRFVSGKFFLNDSGLTVSPKDTILSQNFLNWILIANNNLIYSFGKGSAQKNLDMEEFRSMKISYPTNPSEQQRIVEILDTEFEKIDVLKANAEKNLQNAKDLFQAALKKELEPKEAWEKKTMGELCEIKSLLVNPVEEKYKKLLHVGGANIVSITGELQDLKTAEEEGLTSGKFTFNNNDVLYNKIRPYLVKVARPNFYGLCSADMYPLTPKKSILKDYLYFILTSKDFTNYAILNSGRAGMPKVNRQALFSYKCEIPSLTEQQQIINRLDALNISNHSSLR